MNEVEIKAVAKKVRAIESDRVHVSVYDERGYAMEVNVYPKDWLVTKAGQPASTLKSLCRNASEINVRAE